MRNVNGERETSMTLNESMHRSLYLLKWKQEAPRSVDPSWAPTDKLPFQQKASLFATKSCQDVLCTENIHHVVTFPPPLPPNSYVS